VTSGKNKFFLPHSNSSAKKKWRNNKKLGNKFPVVPVSRQPTELMKFAGHTRHIKHSKKQKTKKPTKIQQKIKRIEEKPKEKKETNATAWVL
jgi:hypothetical protein